MEFTTFKKNMYTYSSESYVIILIKPNVIVFDLD